MKEIFFHEIRSQYVSGMLVTSFIIMTLAFLISLGMMHREYEQRVENYTFSKSISSNELFWNKVWQYDYGEGNTDNSDNATMPMAVVKPPDPLLYITRGMDLEMRQAAQFIKEFPIFNVSFQPDQEGNMANLLYPAPDLLFMIKVLVTLLAVIASYSMISGERERGLLKLMLSTGASRSSIFLGKLTGGLVSIWLAFSAAFLIYVLALVSITPVSLSVESSLRILTIYAASLAIIAVFFCIGAMVSVFTRNSGPGLVLALFLWLLLVFILPGTASLAAQQIVPVESEEKVARMKFEKATSMEREYAEQQGRRANSSTGGYGQRNDEIRDKINEELEKIERDHQNKKTAQTDYTASLARLSPMGSLQHIFATMCRTGITDYEMYLEDLHDGRRALDNAFTSLIQDPEVRKVFTSTTFDMSPEAIGIIQSLFEMAQNVTFRKSTFLESMQYIMLDFLLLIIASIVLVAISFFKFMRYDVR